MEHMSSSTQRFLQSSRMKKFMVPVYWGISYRFVRLIGAAAASVATTRTIKGAIIMTIFMMVESVKSAIEYVRMCDI